MRITLVPFAAVAFGLSLSGQALAQAAPPAGWTCTASFFDTDDGCDCGCGVADPDCATPAFASCEFDQCPDADGADTVPVEANPITCAANACGDGTIDGDEACDDNNTAPGDGCSATCTVETNFICERSSTTGFRRSLTSACRVVACGDGFVDGDEECDDDDVDAGDGCSATCIQEDGFDCDFAEPTVCVRVVCGDSTVNGDEDCDDGNGNAGDGCSAACAEEDGFACITPGAACVAIVCGDGSVDGDESCDDSNAVAGDGCDATSTTVEDGFSCPGAGGACIAIPAGWTCSDSFFGTDDGCDCGCGASDPDCASPRIEDCGGFDGCGDGEIDPNDTTQCIGGGGEGESEGEGEGEGEPAEGEGEPAEGEGEGEGEPAAFCGAAPSSTIPMAGLMAALVVVGRRRRR